MINTVVKTNSKNKDFIKLMKDLDAYLKITDKDEHDFYNQFNAIDALQHVVVCYHGNLAVGCGAFKHISKETVELKRMFVLENYRGIGHAQKIIKILEAWAKEIGYKNCILETGTRQVAAVHFYRKSNYKVTPNYGQYENMKNSISFKKEL